jgi:hypothetical protein
MAIRRKIIPTVILAAFIVLSLPAMAAAQGYNPWWQDRDNGRDNGRRNDDNNRYQRERLRNSARRINDLSRQFERDIDRTLDRSRINGTIREDRINDVARDFRNAADDFKDRLGDARSLYRSTSAARNLLQLGARIDRIMSRVRFSDSRAVSDWAQIRQELRIVSDAFGFRGGDFGYGRGNGW